MKLANVIVHPFTRDGHGAILTRIMPKTPTTIYIVNGLDVLFEILNESFFESALAKPIITISEAGRRNTLGWFTIDKVWQDGAENRHHEINICPESLDRPIEEVCGTLLHEMVHLHNSMKGIQDCSRSGLYHNKRFKNSAEKHGLSVHRHKMYGYCITTLKPKTLDFIKSLNFNNFDLFRKLEGVGIESEDEDETTTKTSSTRKYICPMCKLLIRATKDVRVRCDVCDVLLVQKN